eukprot:gene11623-34331_t
MDASPTASLTSESRVTILDVRQKVQNLHNRLNFCLDHLSVFNPKPIDAIAPLSPTIADAATKVKDNAVVLRDALRVAAGVLQSDTDALRDNSVINKYKAQQQGMGLQYSSTEAVQQQEMGVQFPSLGGALLGEDEGAWNVPHDAWAQFPSKDGYKYKAQQQDMGVQYSSTEAIQQHGVGVQCPSLGGAVLREGEGACAEPHEAGEKFPFQDGYKYKAQKQDMGVQYSSTTAVQQHGVDVQCPSLSGDLLGEDEGACAEPHEVRAKFPSIPGSLECIDGDSNNSIALPYTGPPHTGKQFLSEVGATKCVDGNSVAVRWKGPNAFGAHCPPIGAALECIERDTAALPHHTGKQFLSEVGAMVCVDGDIVALPRKGPSAVGAHCPPSGVALECIERDTAALPHHTGKQFLSEVGAMERVDGDSEATSVATHPLHSPCGHGSFDGGEHHSLDGGAACVSSGDSDSRTREVGEAHVLDGGAACVGLHSHGSLGGGAACVSLHSPCGHDSLDGGEYRNSAQDLGLDLSALMNTSQDQPAMMTNSQNLPALVYTLYDLPAIMTTSQNPPALMNTPQDLPAMMRTPQDQPAMISSSQGAVPIKRCADHDSTKLVHTSSSARGTEDEKGSNVKAELKGEALTTSLAWRFGESADANMLNLVASTPNGQESQTLLRIRPEMSKAFPDTSFGMPSHGPLMKLVAGTGFGVPSNGPLQEVADATSRMPSHGPSRKTSGLSQSVKCQLPRSELTTCSGVSDQLSYRASGPQLSSCKRVFGHEANPTTQALVPSSGFYLAGLEDTDAANTVGLQKAMHARAPYTPPSLPSSHQTPALMPGPCSGQALAMLPGPSSSQAPSFLLALSSGQGPAFLPGPSGQAPAFLPGISSSQGPAYLLAPSSGRGPALLPAPCSGQAPALLQGTSSLQAPVFLPAPSSGQAPALLPGTSSLGPAFLPAPCSGSSQFAPAVQPAKPEPRPVFQFGANGHNASFQFGVHGRNTSLQFGAHEGCLEQRKRPPSIKDAHTLDGGMPRDKESTSMWGDKSSYDPMASISNQEDMEEVQEEVDVEEEEVKVKEEEEGDSTKVLHEQHLRHGVRIGLKRCADLQLSPSTVSSSDFMVEYILGRVIH